VTWRRKYTYVFQEGALFDSLSVKEKRGFLA
jgi:ABC-type transporter Mla maintaining outer membrane lipid asymmetry ATPase subunit MlaF